jgi:hypothetical protein
MARKPAAKNARKVSRTRRAVKANSAVAAKAAAPFVQARKAKPLHRSLLAAAVFILLIALLNYIAAAVTFIVGLPTFLDTWATSLGVMIGGLWAGVAGGVLYNLLFASASWGQTEWVWAFSSIWVAFATWMMYKDGWLTLKDPTKLVVAGFLLALTNTFIMFSISIMAFGAYPTYKSPFSTVSIQDAVRMMLPNPAVASFIEIFLVNVADKLISLTLATAVFVYLPNKYKAYFHDKW